MARNPPPSSVAPRHMRYLPRERVLADFIAEVSLRGPGQGLETDCLEVFVSQRRLVVQRVRWQFPGGQAQICSPVGPARLVELGPDRSLVTLLGREAADALDEATRRALTRLLEQRAAWSAEAWSRAGFTAFRPRRTTGTEHQVDDPAQADFFELGGSVDDKVPHRTLRLGRSHDEIVDDHASHMDGPREREIVVLERLDVATEAGQRAVTRQFGPEVAEVAFWFATHRAACFG